jgi:hypothetical protein
MKAMELTEGSQPVVGTIGTIDYTIDLMRSEQKVKCRIMNRFIVISIYFLATGSVDSVGSHLK